MGLDLIYGRVSRSEVDTYNSFSVSELEAVSKSWFKDYIQTKLAKVGDVGQEEGVLYYSTLYHWSRSSVLGSLYESIVNDSFFLRRFELLVLLPHLKPEVRQEFQAQVIDTFIDGTDFVLVEW